MKKFLFLTFGLVAVLLIFSMIAPPTGKAEVNVNITIPLPGLVIPGPPGLIVVPGAYVYYPPEVGVEIFFYQGYWYRPHGGGWYIASGYNGPWRSVGPRRVPGPLLNLPPGYRRLSPRHERMPYRVVEKNWRTWENERRWDNDRYERGEKHGRRDYGRRGNGGHGGGRGHGRHGGG
jgi:hypothetical protein